MPARPLIVTGDDALLDDLLRLAAAAGADAQVAVDAPGARRWWHAAPLVLLGADQVSAVARAELGRRPGLLLVGLDRDDTSVWRSATDVGAEAVVFLPDSQALLVDRIGTAVEGAGPSGVTVAVLGGRGGAGASTLAAALALTAAGSSHPVLLVDGDPLGGGLDLVLGGEDCHGLRWPDLAQTGGRVSGSALREALPRAPDAHEVTVLSCARADPCPVPPEAMRSVLAAGRRAGELVVADLPRSPDEAADVALAAADLVLLVVPAEVRATAAAARVAVRAGLLARDLRVVVRGPAPAGLTGALVAEALALPLVGWLRPEPGLPAAQERGEPPARTGRGPLAELCRRVLSELLPASSAA